MVRDFIETIVEEFSKKLLYRIRYLKIVTKTTVKVKTRERE